MRIIKNTIADFSLYIAMSLKFNTLSRLARTLYSIDLRFFVLLRRIGVDRKERKRVYVQRNREKPLFSYTTTLNSRISLDIFDPDPRAIARIHYVYIYVYIHIHALHIEYLCIQVRSSYSSLKGRLENERKMLFRFLFLEIELFAKNFFYFKCYYIRYTVFCIKRCIY